MLDTIEKLLVLQDRDRKIHRVQEELAHISPERESLNAKAATTQTQLEAAKTRVKQIESERKRLEIEVESKKSQIEKYANQQLQTRKNEEYRALAQEIEHCKAEITKIEDHEIELMEQAESAQKEVLRAMADASAAKSLVEKQVGELNQREGNLKKELVEFQIPHLRICVTSRPQADIIDLLSPLPFLSVSLHDEIGQKRDIEDYIKSVINTHPENRRWRAEDKQLVVDVLTRKADGM